MERIQDLEIGDLFIFQDTKTDELHEIFEVKGQFRKGFIRTLSRAQAEPNDAGDIEITEFISGLTVEWVDENELVHPIKIGVINS